ncbi:hypothetical protein EJB05_17921, partial [Eragrostis curvula]
MGFGVGAKERSSSRHLVSFLLGAALPTALLFFLTSDRLSEGLSGISCSWGNGTISQPVGRLGTEVTTLTADASAAPAQNLEAEFPGLAELLPKVATEDKTVIFTSVNKVWTRPNSLLDIFLDGFRNGEDTAHLLNHVLIVAVDTGRFEVCKAVHPHCYLLEIKSMNMSMAKWFGSKEYMELVWLKLSLQQRVLELGYNFLIYTTAPVLLDNEINCGFYYMKSTSRSITLIRRWVAGRARFPGDNEQVVLSKIKGELIREVGVRMEALETEYVSGFCDFQKRLDKVCTVHANCCMGLENKVYDLKNVAVD